MISDLNRYVVFNSNTTWILTKEKIASSWLKSQFHFDYIELQINSYTYDIELVPKHPHFTISNEKYLHLQEKFLHDWNKFKSGSSIYDFIFFVRNPIHKFITGWVQDFIIRKFNHGFIEAEHERLCNHFYFKDVDKFMEFSLEQKEKTGDKYPQVDSIPLQFKEIFEECCFPSREYEDFFHVMPNVLLEHTSSGHIPENLYLLWKLIFKQPFQFDTSKLHIFDIDLENVEYTLAKKFNISIEKEVDRYSRGNYLKNRSYKYLSKYYNIINTIVETELFFWFEIVSKLYPETLYNEQTLPNELKSIKSYKKNYFIPEHLNFFSFETHINWWKYEPEEVSLNYTEEKYERKG